MNIWCEVGLEIVAPEAELVAQIFQDEGAGGVVYDDPGILQQVVLGEDEFYGETVLNEVPDRFRVRAYFPVDDRLGERLDLLRNRFENVLGRNVELQLRQVHEKDWAEAWKAYFKPEKIGNVVIKPSWVSYQSRPDEILVELDPGMAFGTGTHPTTRMCLGLLQDLVTPGITVLDLGTGSGILSVAASKLGAARILASDIDPLAVQVAQENIDRNGLTERISLVTGDLLELGVAEEFDVVVANIIAAAIIRLIPGLRQVLKPGARFLASGIIKERFPEVADTLKNEGFLIEKLVEEGEWVALVAVRDQNNIEAKQGLR